MTEPVQALTRRLTQFRDERDWRQFHTLKDLIVSVGIETGELLELTQWKDSAALEKDIDDPQFRTRLGEEASDVFIYLLLIAERAGFDLVAETHRKIDLNAAKYPVAKARGNAKKYTRL